VADPGSLRQKVSFSQRALTSDGYGNQSGDWEAQFEVAARVWPRLGGETVMAARLGGQQPVTIRVRQSSQTRLIRTDWKAVNVRTGVEYNLRSIVDPDEHTTGHGRWLDILAETGGAV
jgi:head-tail adaptor